MGWVENTLDVGASVDEKSAGQTDRVFLFNSPGIDPVQVARRPETFLGGDVDGSGSQPLPARGSEHPIYRSFRLDRYDVQQSGIVTTARALYSSDSRFRYPNITPEPEVGEVRYGSGRAEVTVSMPLIVAKLVVQALPPQFSGPPQAFTQYALDFLDITEARRKRMWTVLLATDEVQDAEDRMDEQDNRLHQILGRWYRFQAADIVPSGNADFPYQATYTWWTDPGTPDTTSTNDRLPAHVKLPPTWTSGLSGIPGSFFRPPFYEFVATSNNDATVAPVIGVMCPYLRDDTGWQSLIGL